MNKAKKTDDLDKMSNEHINIGSTVRRLREEKGMSGVELCRRGKTIDAKTLTALEKGRIKNPSIVTLEALAKGFQMNVSDLFRQAEFERQEYFSLGSQKGLYKIDFPSCGAQLISFTPLTEEMFCGKIILEGQKGFDDGLFSHKGSFFILVLIGQVKVDIEEKKLSLREGDNLYFRGGARFNLSNVLHRNATLLFVTFPSVLAGQRFKTQR